MPRISARRQITLPIEQCVELNFEPGDEVQILAANGVMTVIKKRTGAARGLLNEAKGSKRISDESSRRRRLK